MPAQPELDEELHAMLDAQGYKEQASYTILQLPDAHKWQLMQGFQQSLYEQVKTRL